MEVIFHSAQTIVSNHYTNFLSIPGNKLRFGCLGMAAQSFPAIPLIHSPRPFPLHWRNTFYRTVDLSTDEARNSHLLPNDHQHHQLHFFSHP